MVSKTHGYQDEIAGSIKEVGGKMLGDERMKKEGEMQKLRGKEEIERAGAHSRIVSASAAIEENIREKAEFVAHPDMGLQEEQTKAERLKAEVRNEARAAAMGCSQAGCEKECQCGPKFGTGQGLDQKFGEGHLGTGQGFDKGFEQDKGFGLKEGFGADKGFGNLGSGQGYLGQDNLGSKGLGGKDLKEGQLGGGVGQSWCAKPECAQQCQCGPQRM